MPPGERVPAASRSIRVSHRGENASTAPARHGISLLARQIQGPAWTARRGRFNAMDGSRRPWCGEQGCKGPQAGEKSHPLPEKAGRKETSPRMRGRLCITLGELLAQPPGCPHQSAAPGFCPRWRDTGTRVLRTGLAATQVPVTPRKIALVHRKAGALLLRLCIYKEIKKKTENNIPLRQDAKGHRSLGVRLKDRGTMKRAQPLKTGAPPTSAPAQGPPRLRGASYPGLRRNASSRSTDRGRLKR